MKLAGIPLSVFLFLFVAAFLVLNRSLSTIFQHPIQLSLSPLLLFSLLNTIILALIVGSCKPITYRVDEVLPCFHYSHEEGEDRHDNVTGNTDEDDGDEYCGSDGYEQDDDNNGSDEEVSWDWEDEEENDDNLKKRVEDFIAKVNNGWREEKLRDKLWPG